MLQFSLFPCAIDMSKVDHDRNMHRFYRMAVVPDLFGGASLWREWGRIGSPGRLTCKLYETEGQAVTALAMTARRKARRGYTIRDQA